MGSVWPLVAVEGDPPTDACLGLRPGFPSVQVDAFILQRPPEALNEDVVETGALAANRDPGSDPFQPLGPCERRELRALISVHDLGRADTNYHLGRECGPEHRSGIFAGKFQD